MATKLRKKPAPTVPEPAPRKDVDENGRRKPPGGAAGAEKEAKEIEVWAGRVALAKAANKDWHEVEIPRLRKYVTGEAHSDGGTGLVRTNLIFSTIATTCPFVYARDPQIQVSLTDAVPRDAYKVWKDFAGSLESILGSLFIKGAKLKQRAKSGVRSAMTTAVGWAKVIYQEDTRKDPIIQARINDTQDNIQAIKTLIAQIKAGEASGEDLAGQKLELRQQMAALKADREVSVQHGMIVDRVLTEDILILDETIKDFDYYLEAEAIAHGLWFTEDKYQDTFGYKPPEGCTPFAKPLTEAKDGQAAPSLPNVNGAGVKPPKYLRVWEIWHKRSNTVYTIVEGGRTWARPPYQPKNVGERWYPFFALAFNPVDGRWRPMSDVELLTELQDEYNTTRTNFAEARKSAIPVLIVRAGGELTEADIKRIEERKINQIIVVEGTPGSPIEQEIAFLPTAEIDPAVYDTTPIRNDFDMVSGTADAARGNIDKAKTATEADILQQGLMSRADERRDQCEEWIADMAQYSAEILLDVLKPAQLERLIGAEAAARWPEMSRHQVFELVQLGIKAGSSGKPNEQKNREQWIQLLPEIQKTIEQVFALSASGDPRLARTSLELLKETLERFDEYIDIDRFIPPELLDDETDAYTQMQQALAQCQQQVQQAQEQAQKAMEEAQKFKIEAQAAKSGEQAKLLEAERDAERKDEQMRLEQDAKREQARLADATARRQNTAEALRHTRELAHKERIHKMDLQAQAELDARQAEREEKKLKADTERAEKDRKQKADQAEADRKLKAQEGEATREHASREGDKERKAGAAEAGKDRESQETLAEGKNKTTEKVAANKNATTEKVAKDGNKTKAAIAEGGGDAPAPDTTAKLANALDRLADVLEADQVPIRDKSGKIERVVKEVKPRKKPQERKK